MHRVCKISNFVKTRCRATEPRLGHSDAGSGQTGVCSLQPGVQEESHVSNAQRRRPPTSQNLGITDSV